MNGYLCGKIELMINLLTILTAIVVVYSTMCAVKFGIPESLSATYYSLGKHGWVFQAFMLVVGIGLLPLWLSVSQETYQFLVFLSCASLCFVASAPCFKLELQGKVHYSAAAVCCISVFTWQIVEGLWDVTLWFVWVCGMLTILNRSKWCWWLEVAAVGSLLANLWRLV